MRKILSIFSIFMVCLITISTVSATRTIIVDNDALSSSPGTVRNDGFSYGKGSYNYNDDYRIAPSGTYTSYSWDHKYLDYEHAGYTSYKVYLNNFKFTSTKAAYYVNSGNLGARFACYLNQDTAPGGWTYILKNYIGQSDYVLGGVLDNRFSSGSGQVGADAFQMIVTN